MIEIMTGDNGRCIQQALRIIAEEIEKIRTNKLHKEPCGCVECDNYHVSLDRLIDAIGEK